MGIFYKGGQAVELQKVHLESKYVNILWCARFIDWKHPELAILLAQRLKDNKYNFHLDMIGKGMN